MKKIVSLYQRNYDGDRLVRDEVVPGAEWVLAGEGVATQKLDGTSCMVRDGQLFKRYDAKHGKPAPPNFVPAQDPDPVTGHWPGWVPVGDGPDDRWHREALASEHPDLENGTYELIGPKVQGNPEGCVRHILWKHGAIQFSEPVPTTFDALKTFLERYDIEGIVWWRDIDDPDCDKVKIKKRDFGLRRKP